MSRDEIQKALVNYAFKTQNANFQKCIAPEGLGTCNRRAIRAHSIQNRQILDLLQQDGHVVMLNITLDGPSSVKVGFEHVGRNKATTFTGLCSNHDHTIFAPIEEKSIDIENEYHLFLLAYRAVIKQTHASMNAAYQAGLLTNKKKEMGLLPDDVLSDEEEQALLMTFSSHQTYWYKVEYDRIFLNQEYDKVCHDVIRILNQEPTIAVNSLFNPRDNVQGKSEIERIALNIFPRENETIVIFSYLCEDGAYIKPHIGEILEAKDQHRRYLISKLVLRYCENFVLSPRHFDSISEDSRRAMIDFFISTITQDRLDFEDQRLNLL